MKIARLNTLPRMDDVFAEGEPDFRYMKRQIIIVEDDYDFNTNNATDLTDTDENRIINFHLHGINCVGRFTNFMDWMCLRTEIQKGIEALGGIDYASYSGLSSDIRAIGASYLPTKIVDHVGFIQLVTDCSGDIGLAAQKINDYLTCSEHARDRRYSELVNYAYQALGKNDGLAAEDAVINEQLAYKFIKRGVGREAQDTVKGLMDWLDATGSYSLTGLKQLIIDNILTIKNGTPLQTFIDNCVGIVDEGKY